MAKTDWRRGQPLDEAVQLKLRALIKEHGEAGAADLIGLSCISVVRAAAGSTIRKVTAIAIEAKLALLAAPTTKRAAK